MKYLLGLPALQAFNRDCHREFQNSIMGVLTELAGERFLIEYSNHSSRLGRNTTLAETTAILFLEKCLRDLLAG
jgi:hypothetical protein